MNKNRKRALVAVLLSISVVCVAVGIYVLCIYQEPATVAGFKRQEEEQQFVDQFIYDMLEQYGHETDASTEDGGDGEDMPVYEGEEETETEKETYSDKPIIDLADWQNYGDVNWYSRDDVTYTPDFAEGDLAYVLYMPTVSIKRGVYTSKDRDKLTHDLDIWMVVELNPYGILGETNISIIGHNHPTQDLSFNQLKNIKLGDLFYIYDTKGQYTYEVTDYFSAWRETGRDKYAGDLTLGADKCYVFTCGRGEMACQDLIVEGTMTDFTTWSKYRELLAKEQKQR